LNKFKKHTEERKIYEIEIEDFLNQITNNTSLEDLKYVIRPINN